MVVEQQRTRTQGFRDLDVYQRSFALVRPIYDLLYSWPTIEKYDLASQMRRAAKSIPANIGEGYALRTDAPRLFCKHLRIAYGSAVEMQIHFDLARELGYVSEEVHGQDALSTVAALASEIAARRARRRLTPTPNV